MTTTTPIATDQLGLRQQLAAQGLLARDGRWPGTHLAVVVAAYAAVATVAASVDRPALWLVAWGLLSFLLLGAVATVHEAVHQNLSSWRAVNRAAGLVAGLVLLVPWSAYRWFHHDHHLTTATRADPEGDNTIRSRAMYLLLPLGGVVFFARLWWHGLAGVLGRPPRWVRRGAAHRGLVLDTLATAAVAGVGVALALDHPLVLRLWLVPVLVAMACWLPFITLPEHHGSWDLALTEPDQLATTSTIPSNVVVRFVYLNTNHHAAHHFSPRVPGRNLPAADAVLGGLQPPGVAHFGVPPVARPAVAIAAVVGLLGTMSWRSRLMGQRPSEVGREPDPRFSLANERTFLAWNRTALALIGAGLAVVQLLPPFDLPGGRHIIGLPLVIAGALTALVSLRDWARNERALRLGRPLPGTFLTVLLAATIAAVGLAALVIVLISDER